MDEVLRGYVKNKYGKKTFFVVSIEGCLLYSAYPEYEHDITHISDYEKIYYGCRAGRTKMEIYPDGNVYPCICFENVFLPTSNVTKENLTEIWKNDYNINILRKSEIKNNECRNCGYHEICNGGCLALRQQYYGEDSCIYKDTRCSVHDI